jgi:hypothetical protein
MTAEIPGQVPWWKEPTKDQWMAWIAAWLGWTLDAFDFTIFLLIMVPIAESFHVPLNRSDSCIHHHAVAVGAGRECIVQRRIPPEMVG